MTWIFYSLLAAMLLAAVNVIDKYTMDKVISEKEKLLNQDINECPIVRPVEVRSNLKYRIKLTAIQITLT